MHQEGVATHNHVYEHGLATSVRAYDSDVLTLAGFKVDWLCHTPFGHTGHAILYTDNLLHIHSVYLWVVLLRAAMSLAWGVVADAMPAVRLWFFWAKSFQLL